MGRIAGLTAAETRERLLDAAAVAFETTGYDATRVADIASAAGLSNGALYSHFGSKSELLVEALRSHVSRQLALLFLENPDQSVADLFVTIGSTLVEPSVRRGGLVAEALVASRRDADVAEMMRAHLGEREAWLHDLMTMAQRDGLLDVDLSPEVLARFCLMIVLGSTLLAETGLPAVDGDDWATFVSRLVSSFGPSAVRHDDPPNTANTNGAT